MSSEKNSDGSNKSGSSHKAMPSSLRANSIKEVGFIELGSKGVSVKYGSSQSKGSGSMSMSQREISDQDSRAVFGRFASILPLTMVLLVTAIKDAYEDWRRHRSDRIENNRLSSVLTNNTYQPKKWKDIQVGDVIKFSANETIPCDIVLLSTSDPTGVAYIQTINLDGESNLKTRYAKQETISRTNEDENISGVIRNLFEQFHRVAYVYFLIIAVLNQLPQLAVFGRFASILPLTMVLLVTAIKDAYEDWRRHSSDRIENNRLSSVLTNNTY
nr:phospholipid-transporting ATPase 1-like [Tanacetum cinerariifolium]